MSPIASNFVEPGLVGDNGWALRGWGREYVIPVADVGRSSSHRNQSMTSRDPELAVDILFDEPGVGRCLYKERMNLDDEVV